MKKLVFLALALLPLFGCPGQHSQYLNENLDRATMQDVVLRYGPPSAAVRFSNEMVCRWNRIEHPGPFARTVLDEPPILEAGFSMPDGVLRWWKLRW